MKKKVVPILDTYVGERDGIREIITTWGRGPGYDRVRGPMTYKKARKMTKKRVDTKA